jgi:hypothetical protein
LSTSDTQHPQLLCLLLLLLLALWCGFWQLAWWELALLMPALTWLV